MQMQDIKESKQSTMGNLLPKNLLKVTKHFGCLEDAEMLYVQNES